jgi:hypothetical protein
VSRNVSAAMQYYTEILKEKTRRDYQTSFVSSKKESIKPSKPQLSVLGISTAHK